MELGFGSHVLCDSNRESFYDMACIRTSPSTPATVERQRMSLECVLSREAVSAARHARIHEDAASAASTAATARAAASARHLGGVKTVPCLLNGAGPRPVPIVRCLRVDGGAEQRPTRLWVEYDTEETSEDQPQFTFRALQAALSACALPLPQLSGRWRLNEVRA